MKKRRIFCALLLASLFPLSVRAGEAPVTRGEFALLLWESQGGVPFDKTAHPFTDLPEDGHAQAVAWAWSEGLVRGVGEDRFAPDRPLTREECATLLRRLDAQLGFDVFLPLGASLCNDYEGVNLWAGDDLYWACITARMGWLDNRLAPLGPVTWDEAQGLLFDPQVALSGSEQAMTFGP